jgi:type IV pilus assembly protein PilW
VIANARSSFARGRLRGLSLIELMVTLVIGAIMVVAISTVMIQFEARKRRTTAVNDANQSGSYGLYTIDRWLRSAGSGFAQTGTVPNGAAGDREAMGFGCRVLAAQSGAQVLPSTATPAFPDPFQRLQPISGSAGTLRLAPAIIASGQSGATGLNGAYSDALVVMAGTSGYSEIYTELTGPILGSQAPVQNAAVLHANDIVMLIDEQAGGGAQDCMVRQIASPLTSPPGLGGTYATGSSVASVADSSFDDKSVLVNLGSTNNPPNFFAIGVGTSNTLYAYDLLKTRNPALQAIGDNVVELHAVYGVDANGDNVLETWVDPAATPASSDLDYSLGTLMDGSANSADKIASIKALRVALVLRSPLLEKVGDEPTGSTLTVFSGEAFARSRTLSSTDQRYRYRIVDSVIPLRNALLAR